MTSIYDFPLQTIEGAETTLAAYRGKTLLIVNVASQCGFTPQYLGLEKLYQDYQRQGLVVLAFPCNQFGGQEPGNEAMIKEFCEQQYHIDFPLFAKIKVNGKEAHPLYRYLKQQAKGILGSSSIKWNFTKFLVNSKGEVVKRYAPNVRPEEIAQDLPRYLTG